MNRWKTAGLGLLLLSAVWIQGRNPEKAAEMTIPKAGDEERDRKETETQTSQQIYQIEQVYTEKSENLPEQSNWSEQTVRKASPSVSGALQVKGTQLADSYGNPVQLKGISTHGIAWFPDYINTECFRQLHNDWNINVIRLAMYTAEAGGYCTDGDREYLKELIRKGVAYATEQDMYVLIDWHILSDCNPVTYMKEAKEFFAEMSAEYAEYNNVLYEICNEPNGQTSWEQIKAYAEEMIPVIRENDQDGIIIVGTPNWSQYVGEAAANPITGYDNIMYTLHFYAATHTESLRNAMTEAEAAGLPIFVTEFGICDASGNGAIDKEQAEKWIDAMNSCNISYIAWNLSNKNETSAIFKSGCQKTAGFEEADLSDSGKWLYHMLTKHTEYPASSSEQSETLSCAASGASAEIQEEITAENSFTASSDRNGLSYETVQRNSWEAEGKTFYQFEVIIKNNSEKSCDGWEIAIPFNQSIMLSEGWNGNYSVDDTVLHITSKEYNGMIAPDGEAANIGFIVSSSGGLMPGK